MKRVFVAIFVSVVIVWMKKCVAFQYWVKCKLPDHICQIEEFLLKPIRRHKQQDSYKSISTIEQPDL